MSTKDMHQNILVRTLERVLIGFFLLATLFLLLVYFIDPSIYTDTLMLAPSPTNRYPLAATLFLVGIVVFIAFMIVGVLQHWRWLYWLLLIAFGFSILQIPAGILQQTGVLPGRLPLWYGLSRMGVALIQGVIAVWMVYIYRQYGVWAMGKKKSSRQVVKK